MANDKHVIMKHSLAKALMDAGMHHFDVGGGVPGNAPANTYSSPTAASVGGSSQQGSMASSPSWVASGFSNPIGSAGASAQGIGAAFTAQNGYQAQLAPTRDLDYSGAVNQSLGNSFSGYGQSQNIQAQQQGLANQLLQQSQGQGPNPVQSQLAQNTGNNIQAQAALMASQRGAGANAGLIARQAAQQGAATQQAATGQAATLGAQQQLAAQQALQQQQQNMAQGNVAEQQANNSLYGSSVAGNNTQNANTITNWGNAQGINSQVAQNNANAVNKTTGGLMNGAGSVLSMLSRGGEVGKDGAKAELPEHLKTVGSIYHPARYADGGGVAAPNNTVLQGGVGIEIASPTQGLSKMGGSGGGAGGSSGDAPSGAGRQMPDMFASGGAQVPGKAKVKGNSPKNDVVPALLSPGEDVLPRSVTQGPNAPEKAAEFVRHLQERDGKKKSKGGYGDVADAKGDLASRVAALEKIVAKKKGK